VYRVLKREECIDYLVILTTFLATFVAERLPIILTFLGTELRDLTNLDSILSVVDAETFDEEYFHSEAALQQITYGDIIILNKTNLVTQRKLQVENFIRDLKNVARISHSQYGQVPLPLISDVVLTRKYKYISQDGEDTHEHEHHYSYHLENNRFVSIYFQSV
jgi:G3E family GTPase